MLSAISLRAQARFPARPAASNTANSAGGFYNEHTVGTVTIDGGSIRNNTARTDHGGGFRNRGTVSITGADITLNKTLGNGNDWRVGGGFFNEGVLANTTIVDGSITDNTAYGGGAGFCEGGNGDSAN